MSERTVSCSSITERWTSFLLNFESISELTGESCCAVIDGESGALDR